MRDDLQAQLENLTPEDRELLELLLAEESALPTRVLFPAQTAEAEVYPLSFAQQRLWFLNQLEPDIPFYHISAVYRLTGALNVTALQQSLQTILQRHAVLRTNLVMSADGPVQIINEQTSFDVPIVDIQGWEEGNSEEAALLMAREEMTRPFNLARDLMLRAKLLRLGEESHLLVIVMHHVASDGWSQGVFWREFKTLYEAFAAGKPSPLPPLPVQYANYAVWQRAWLQGDILDSQVDYWRRQLNGLPTLDVPADYPRPTVNTYQGTLSRIELSPELTARLRDLARRQGVTLYMVLLAAFFVLLHRVTGQDDFAVGSPIANRRRRELEELIGFFANTLVMRGDLAGNPTFREVLQRVRATALAAYDHQDVPFERLVEELQPQRDLSRNPLFQVMFALQNVPYESASLSGLRVERLHTAGNGTSLFDLSLFLSERPEGLVGTVQYRSDLFAPATIQRLIGNYRTLLDAAVEDPEQTIDQMPILTDLEQRHLLSELGSAAPLDGALPAHRLFEAQAAHMPEAVALIDGDQQFTYQQVEQRANRMARRLIELGVGPDDCVALYMTRSAETIITLLSILKAGGAYLPLDPANPPARLQWMLADSQAAYLILPSGQADPFDPADVLVFNAQDLEAAASGLPSGAPDVPITGDHLVYVMYTSGSTGRPKGVAMRHGAVANLLAWHVAHPILGQAARTLQFSALSFDVSFQEIFTTWGTGGALVLLDQATRRDPQAAVDVIRDQAVERVFLPNVALQQVAAILARDSRPDVLRTVVTAGEQLQVTAEIRRMAAGREGFTLHNQYGPTEAHVVSEHILAGDPERWPALPPIGRPLPGVRLYVLDGNQQLLPVGAPGELVIGGVALARGYLHQPDLTRERFVDDPYAGTPGALMYRTGDLARWLTEGELAFLGRIDDQVKIRGFRVEPAEVEAVLRRHPRVREAAVVAREDVPGDRRLAAYIVGADPEANLDLSQVRDFLSRQLPEYMIPADFVMLESLPQSAHGKTDRAALPAPDLRDRLSETTYCPPRTPVEETLAAIWREVLRLEQVGVHDNFFDIGGHSLVGIQVFARIEDQFGQRLPLSLLFSAPTIAQLARHLAQPSAMPQSPTLVPIREGDRHTPFFLVHGFGGSVLGYADLARALDDGVPIFGLQAQGLSGEAPVDPTVEAMAARYVAAMREVQPAGPYRFGGYCFGGVVAYEMARQLAAAGERAALVAILEGYAPRRFQRQTPALSLRRWQTVWQNVPYWLEDYWSLGIDGVRERIARKGRIWRKTALQRTGREAHIDAQDVLPDDLSVMPSYHRQLMEAHLSALRNYDPAPYDGRVTLFAAQGQTISKAFFGSGDPEHGWRALARDGVEVIVVDGGHRDIHLPPNVSSLAAALSDKLRATDSAA